jgi:hypothetical protein
MRDYKISARPIILSSADRVNVSFWVRYRLVNKLVSQWSVKDLKQTDWLIYSKIFYWLIDNKLIKLIKSIKLIKLIKLNIYW